MIDLIVIMPVFNEEKIIHSVLCKWSKALEELEINYQIWVYNDGSKDNSLKEILRYTAQNPRVLSFDKVNSGHGPTILTGYKRACTMAAWIFQIDSDDEMGPEYFKDLWSNRKSHDFLIGTRIHRKSSFLRNILSLMSKLCVNLLFGKSISDVNSPYRLLRTSFFKHDFHNIPLNTFAPNVILSGVACTKKARIYSIPVPYNFRKTGVVSISGKKIFLLSIKCGLQTINYKIKNIISKNRTEHSSEFPTPSH